MMILRSIDEGDNSITTSTKLITDRVGLTTKHVASDDEPPNTELGLQRISLEENWRSFICLCL